MRLVWAGYTTGKARAGSIIFVFNMSYMVALYCLQRMLVGSVTYDLNKYVGKTVTFVLYCFGI